MKSISVNKESRIRLLILAGLSVFSLGCYIAFSYYQYRIGFPLDDAWIHQTYARNVAAGEWSFIPGKISGGSTSPLWTLILSIGYVLKIPPLIWIFGINTFVLWIIAVIAECHVRDQASSYRPFFPWVGSIFAFEWHFVWAAGSGMETLLFTAFVLAIFVILSKNHLNFQLIGLLIGLGIWLRPEGITLIVPVLLVWFLKKNPWKQKIKDLVILLLPLGTLIVLYLLFFYQLNGSPFPTTFYAKQAEYQSITSTPILIRMGYMGIQLLVGAGIILMPGLIIEVITSATQKIWISLSSFIWLILMIYIYAWKLPVTYQHGRYMIPCIVILILFGVIGMLNYLKVSNNRSRILSRSWKLSLAIVLIYFWFSGAISYGKDVEFIETQMVETSIWVSENIPSGSTIAAHDIGALGYFGKHPIIDLAGLIDPEVIPIMGRIDQLGALMDDSNVFCIMIFPDWYPDLIEGLPVLYSGLIDNSEYKKSMVVYKWRK